MSSTFCIVTPSGNDLLVGSTNETDLQSNDDLPHCDPNSTVRPRKGFTTDFKSMRSVGVLCSHSAVAS